MREYAESFNWLEESRIVNIARNATDPNVALAMSEDYDTQKLYAADTGLLVTQAFESRPYTENEIYRALLLDRLSVNEGMVAENVVAQTLTAGGDELFFYSRNGKQGDVERMEIDFLIRRGSRICPVEVKSATYQQHASLDKLRRRFGERLGPSTILYTKDVMVKDGIIHLPLYMSSLV